MFDVAQRLLLVDVEDGVERRRGEFPITEEQLGARAMHMADLAVDVLICCAISRPLEAMLVSRGIQVIPQTCGSVEEVLRAFESGQLTEEAFLMPGCCGRRRRFRGRGDRGRGRFSKRGGA